MTASAPALGHPPIGDLRLLNTSSFLLAGSAAGGLHHFIPLDFVQAVEAGTGRLDRPAEEVMREWSTS